MENVSHGYEFEWDPANDAANRRKHGVSFAERGSRTRLISARLASRQERTAYEEGHP